MHHNPNIKKEEEKNHRWDLDRSIGEEEQTSLLEISDWYGRTKLTVSFEGMVEGVGGRGFM